MLVFFLFFFCFLMVLLFLFLIYLLSFSFLSFSTSVSSPFECGFDPMNSLVVFFSMPFFLVTIMFLLFDVEVLVLCFYPLFLDMTGEICFYSIMCIIIILFSTLYEWSVGVIGWL